MSECVIIRVGPDHNSHQSPLSLSHPPSLGSADKGKSRTAARPPRPPRAQRSRMRSWVVRRSSLECRVLRQSVGVKKGGGMLPMPTCACVVRMNGCRSGREERLTYRGNGNIFIFEVNEENL